MRHIGSLSVLFVSSLACHAARANEQLPPVEVTADIIGGTATIPVSLMNAFHLGQPPSTPDAAQIDSLSIDMTREQVCQVLRDNKPDNCTTRNYPAAPRIRSASGAAWAGNGCGAGPWTTALGTGYLTVLLPGVFSGDLNRPVQGNPSIDFTAFCNGHDRGYTSFASKQTVDQRFADALHSFCQGSTDQQLCNGFASTYVKAVQKYGVSAYAEDQAQLKCAAWGDSMKKNQCGA